MDAHTKAFLCVELYKVVSEVYARALDFNKIQQCSLHIRSGFVTYKCYLQWKKQLLNVYA